MAASELMGALAAFFTLSFAYSWSVWIAAAVIAARSGEPADPMLIYAGIPGPAVAACILLVARASPGERRDFWRRLYEVERVGIGWLAFIVLAYPALTAAAVGLDHLLGGQWPDTGRVAGMLRDPVVMLSTGAATVLLGPLPEEPGWRGYALDRLLRTRGAVSASVVVGLFWAVWHLPLFFVPGAYQYGLGFGTLRFALFNVTAVALSVLVTWVYRCNDRSTCSAILLHAAVNFTITSLVVSERTEVIRTSLLVLLALLVVHWRFGVPSLVLAGSASAAADGGQGPPDATGRGPIRSLAVPRSWRGTPTHSGPTRA